MTTENRIYSRRTSVLLLFLAVVSLVFRHALVSMWQSWGQEEYSFGYIIPVLALVLLLNAIADGRPVPKNSWAGFALVLFCVGARFMFEVAGVRGVLPEIYVLCIIGVFILFLGLAVARSLIAPLLLLLFAAPLPNFVYYTLSFHMQSLSTSLGVKLLQVLGISVFQDGNIIDLGGYKLQVAAACSGLRYLFPLLALSFLLAAMYRAKFIKRVVLFLSALPIAIIMNGLRIAFIGVTVDRWGAAMAEGVIHDFEGWAVFLGCTACLFAEMKLLQYVGAKGRFDYDRLRLPKLRPLPLPASGKPVYAAALVLVLAAFSSFASSDMSVSVALRQSFTTFPQQIGSWIGRFGSLPPEALSHLGTDDYLIADYTKAETTPVNLYVLYYAHQDSTSNSAVHTPTVCIPGGGWTIEDTSVRTVALKGGGELKVNRVLISKNTVRQIVYYWYIQNGYATLNPYVSRLYMLGTALADRRTNGAMVRVLTMVSGGEAEDGADSRLTTFINDSYGTVNDFMFPH